MRRLVLVVSLLALTARRLRRRATIDRLGRASARRATGTEVDWPIFGRVLERTHYIAEAPDPPFHYLWEFFAKQLIEFPPVLEDDVLFVVNKTGEVFAVRTTDGKQIWTGNLGNDVTSPAYQRRDPVPRPARRRPDRPGSRGPARRAGASRPTRSSSPRR